MLSPCELADIRQIVREEIRIAIADFMRDAKTAMEELIQEKRKTA